MVSSTTRIDFSVEHGNLVCWVSCALWQSLTSRQKLCQHADRYFLQACGTGAHYKAHGGMLTTRGAHSDRESGTPLWYVYTR